MKSINKIEILAIFTTICLIFGHKPAYSINSDLNLSEKAENQNSPTVTTEFVQASAFSASSTTMMEVDNSLVSIPIPQPLIILCVLGMAGFSGFLKLKIAEAKYQPKEMKETEELQLPELVNH